MKKNIDKIYVDKGLKRYFMNIYQYIGVNLALAGAVAFAIASNSTLFSLIFGSPLMFVVMFAPVGIVLYMNAGFHSFSTNKLQSLFWLYGASIGASLSSIFIIYSMESIFRCFFMASAVFIGASIYGRITSNDLSSIRSTLIIALWGVFFTSLFNMLMQSSAIQYIISILMIVLFSGFIAYDMQQLLGIYFTRQSEEMIEKVSIMGALHLFISMINIFVAMLNLYGDRRK